MKIQRRGFVALGVGSMAAGRSLANTTNGFHSRQPVEFEKFVGSRLVARDSSGQMHQFELVEVSAGRRPKASMSRPISLVLRNSAEERFAQDVYTFSHPALGKADLLVVPCDHKQQYGEVILA